MEQFIKEEDIEFTLRLGCIDPQAIRVDASDNVLGLD